MLKSIFTKRNCFKFLTIFIVGFLFRILINSSFDINIFYSMFITFFIIFIPNVMDQFNLDSFINFFRYYFIVKADSDTDSDYSCKTNNTNITSSKNVYSKSSNKVRTDLSFANRVQTQNVITSYKQPIFVSPVENISSKRTPSLRRVDLGKLGLRSKSLQDSVVDSHTNGNTIQKVESLKLDLVNKIPSNTGNNNNNPEYLSVFYRSKRKAC
jgi:hypothetical protein